ncbi:MAG: hypothetical protein V3W18_14295 [candidate division Zixibacteria bacterium]
MFEDLINEIKRMNGRSISVPIESDEKGYIDKQCPSEECEFLFKVNDEDWGNIFKDEAVWCPLCRHEAPSDQWFTIEQVEHAKSEALAVVQGRIHNALGLGAQRFNRKQPKNSFVSISLKLHGGIKRTYTVPAKTAEEMQLEIMCEECSSRFAVIGSAFFCPACGHNSVFQTYSDSLRKIKAKRDNIEVIRQAITEAVDKDEAELTCRSLRETCISDGVVAFQRYCERLYSAYGDAPFNAFQRLDQGGKLWKAAIHKGYEHWLTNAELTRLNILYQKRHILVHNEGIVDIQYLNKSGDTFYKEGQRIVVSDKDIDDILICFKKLGSGLKDACENT